MYDPAMVISKELCCMQLKWKEGPLTSLCTRTIVKLHVQHAHRMVESIRDGDRNPAEMVLSSCTTALWQARTTQTMGGDTITFACTLSQNTQTDTVLATRTETYCMEWNTKIKVVLRETRITTKMLPVQFAKQF
jgi:hypothetical protein